SAADEFDYSTIDSLTKFTETHPSVMQKRIKQQNWDFTFDTSKLNLSLKDKLLLQIEKLSGWRVGENKNFKVI
ncbi:MAG TPA: glycosyltransferase family 2 protein, partial [Bacteroidia bacterium]